MKSYLTAVVLIPPEEVWQPIQAIRQIHDRKFRRWMPHVTLLYPFIPPASADLSAGEPAQADKKELFVETMPKLKNACSKISQFEITLHEFKYFNHGQSFTMWLDTEPVEQIKELHKMLFDEFPDLDDTNSFSTGFTPHLSVGQTEDQDELKNHIENFQTTWKPLTFTAQSISIICRGERYPDDVFQVHESIKLGA